MKPKTKPIRDLYFRFIEGTDLDGKINAQEVAKILSDAGIIDLVPHRTRPAFEHYTDSIALKDFDPKLRELYIRDVIRATRGTNGLT